MLTIVPRFEIILTLKLKNSESGKGWSYPFYFVWLNFLRTSSNLTFIYILLSGGQRDFKQIEGPQKTETQDKSFDPYKNFPSFSNSSKRSTALPVFFQTTPWVSPRTFRTSHIIDLPSGFSSKDGKNLSNNRKLFMLRLYLFHWSQFAILKPFRPLSDSQID